MLTDEMRNLPITRPSVGEDEWLAVREPLVSGWLTQGAKVAEFEAAFAARHGVKHAIATTSCTTALHLALVALDIRPGDEVIVPAFTWVATANVVRYCGATPVFSDVDPVTFNIDPEKIAAAITPRTKAIVPVHLFGLCADMDTIAEVAGEIPLVEDAACAAGAAYRGRPAGSLGRIGCFSFHPRKIITTGEGGMVTTNDDQLAERINMLRNHGASLSEEQRHHGAKPYLLPDFNMLGFNYRMTDLQGAVGIVQLTKLDEFVAERRRLAAEYTRQLANIAWLHAPIVNEAYQHSWQTYVCRIDEGTAPLSCQDIMQQLQEWGIGVRPGTHAIPDLGLYDTHKHANEYPHATYCSRQTIALPLFNGMTTDDIDYVARTLETISK